MKTDTEDRAALTCPQCGSEDCTGGTCDADGTRCVENEDEQDGAVNPMDPTNSPTDGTRDEADEDETRADDDQDGSGGTANDDTCGCGGTCCAGDACTCGDALDQDADGSRDDEDVLDEMRVLMTERLGWNDEDRAAKYTQKQVNALGKKGQAFKNPDGSFSYPIADKQDLSNAIHAVGRGNASHDAIRKYIIGRAKALGASDQIPDSWGADGSVKTSSDEPAEGREAAACATPRQRRSKQRHAATPAPREARVAVGELSASGNALHGVAIQYSTPYTVHDMFGQFRETMAPTVCNAVLSGNVDCRYLINHDGLPLGRTISGTLELDNTPTGLATNIDLDMNNPRAQELYSCVERGDVSQMSCAFQVAEDEWDDTYTNRTIYSFRDLSDVSAVTYPASPTTTLSVAQRMLHSLPVSVRGDVARSYNIICDIRGGEKLEAECAEYVLRALGGIVEVSDLRVPTTRAVQAYKLMREVRAGKTLSAANAAFISSALEALHAADDVDIPTIVRSLEDIDEALDVAQEALASVTGVPNPDGDENDLEPALEGEPMRSEADEAELRAARRRRVRAERERLALHRPRR